MFRKSILASSLSLLLVPSGVLALGLGGIRPESALNQPFVGEIDLVGANPDELDAVKVTLASDAEFTKRGIDWQQSLTKLRFKPQISPRGKPVIRVTSREPIREPYMDFLVEVVWPSGRMVKGYTVLLDPPVTSRHAPPPMTPAVASPLPLPPREPVETRPSRLPPAVSVPVQSSAAPAQVGEFPLSTGPIPAGAGLWRVARKLAPPGATVAQTAMALYRNNQQAFVRGDINLLRQGEVLQVPSSAELFALDAAAAKGEYQAALAGRPVTAKPLTDVTAGPDRGSRLRIAGSAVETEREGGSRGEMPAPGDIGSPTDMERELLLVRETSESTRQEAEELRTRVQQLETRLVDIQTLLTLRNAELARLQVAGGTAPTPSEAEAGDQPAEQSESAEAGITSTGLETLPVPGGPDQSGAGESAAGLEPAAKATDEAASEAPATSDIPPTATSLDEAAQKELKGVVTEMPAKPKEVAQPDRSKESWLDSLPLVGGALKAVPTPVLWVLALAGPLLVVLGWLSVRRRRRLDVSLSEFDLPNTFNHQDQTAPTTAPISKTTEAFHDSDLENQPPADSADYDHANLDVPEDEADESDVTSEADIYIAYGRYRDAEALLKQAIARSPRRADLRFKLAEVFAGAKNQDGLKALMGEMESAGMNLDHPEQWDRLLDLAKSAKSAESESDGLTLGSTLTDTGRHHSTSPLDLDTELSLDDPVSNDQSSQDLDLDLDFVVDEQRPSSDASGATLATDRNFDMGLSGEQADNSTMELTLGDLTPATDMDLTELGFPAATASEGVQPDGAVHKDIEEFAFEPVVGQDDHDTGESADLLDAGSASEQDAGSSDLLTSQWPAEGDLWDEVGTKLDLGRAYVEMNDRGAAESILSEVVAEGNPEQQIEAQQLLARLEKN